MSDHDLLQEIRERLARIEAFLVGDPGSDRPGLIGRVDRLEQAEERRKWAVRAAVGSAITAVMGAVSSWLRVRIG